MADFLATINSWFKSIGLGTDWTVTWEVLFSFGTALVSIIGFGIKRLFFKKSEKSEKYNSEFESQQNDIFEGQSAVYFNGEVVIFFRKLDDKGQYFESVEGRIKFTGQNGKYKDEGFAIRTDGQFDTRSHSFQGFNNYIVQLIGIERTPDKERSKATLSVIKIPSRIRFYKQIQSYIKAITVGLLAHAVLLSRFGDTIKLSNISFATIIISGFITWIAWLWIKFNEWLEE